MCTDQDYEAKMLYNKRVDSKVIALKAAKEVLTEMTVYNKNELHPAHLDKIKSALTIVEQALVIDPNKPLPNIIYKTYKKGEK